MEMNLLKIGLTEPCEAKLAGFADKAFAVDKAQSQTCNQGFNLI